MRMQRDGHRLREIDISRSALITNRERERSGPQRSSRSCTATKVRVHTRGAAGMDLATVGC